MAWQWSSGTSRPSWNRKTGPVPVPAIEQKPNVKPPGPVTLCRRRTGGMTRQAARENTPYRRLRAASCRARRVRDRTQIREIWALGLPAPGRCNRRPDRARHRRRRASDRPRRPRPPCRAASPGRHRPVHPAETAGVWFTVAGGRVTGVRRFFRGCVLRFLRCAHRSPRPSPRRPVRGCAGRLG
jgi:hypothetical protein